MGAPVKYATAVIDWLREAGYTHCFFIAGGNIMHLLDAVRTRMTCVPFVHEVAAGIAVEYFNEIRGEHGERAFALVTAGPGVTNVMTALAGAFLESRELLVLAGQVKSSDLAGSTLRQRGIQEVDGVALARPLTVISERIEQPLRRAQILAWIERGRTDRKGPVFLELTLDAQGAPVDQAALEMTALSMLPSPARTGEAAVAAGRDVARRVREARRPVLLLGGGVARETIEQIRAQLTGAGVAVMTTWNGMDRVGSADPNYFGRPNTWGQRSSNILLQQADLLVAVGTRLGLQQTGFNHGGFAPLATVIQVEIDEAELRKGHPRVDVPIRADANIFLVALMAEDLGEHSVWLAFCRSVRTRLPLADPANTHAPGFIDPFVFMQRLSALCTARDVVVPCSSGGAFTTAMQAFEQRYGQRVVTNKGLAAMGYGLAGAIGAALARPARRAILLEGDGGFSQNLQELATVAVHSLRLKMFIVSNGGYASIRMTQRNYFGGEYLGCDVRTGLGFPNWPPLFGSFGIPALTLSEGWEHDAEFRRAFSADGPVAFIVPVDPEQTYFPKISSRVTASGSMESNPLHLMSPDLPDGVADDVLPYLQRKAATLP